MRGIARHEAGQIGDIRIFDREIGRQLSIEFSVALLRDDAGTIVGIAAVMREVSERRATEKALRAKLAEAERTVTALRATVADLTDRAWPPTMSVQGWSEQPCTTTSFDA